ncbi:glycosyl hydrolase [Paenibacillus tianjinensis]|uniref:S-layer homology domain-containing protein n=1 Tax=Paenibacillus tianjinensis TaxID=2810347 RepID=A0ABX7LF46_9BACL|nr:glycosyl hydrolase [Paenibacillus tianjinensis]QSF45841.1 S-layer homology domain-containing protein [Paenibacillus tianjinensis]
MKKFKKSFLLLLTAIMLFSMAAPALAGSNAQEKPDTHWAKESIGKWRGNGVIQGYPDGSFKPDNQVTRAELASIINKLFGFSTPSGTPFSDVPAGAWYARDLAIAKQAGYYKGFPDNQAKADTQVTRQDAAVLLASVFSLTPASGGITAAYTDGAAISAYAAEAVQALKGMINGYPDGSFRPDRSITRAEAVSIIDRLVSGYYTMAGTFTGGDITGNVLVNRSGVVLKDTRITGNLYLAPGIGSGEAALDNVTVQGSVYVSGGGENSIHFKNSKLAVAQVNRPDGKVRIVAEGNTSIGRLLIESASIIELESGATITTAVIGNNAQGTAVSGKGAIGRLEVLASSVSLNGKTLPQGRYTVKDGTAAAEGTTAGSTAGSNPGSSEGTGGTGGSGGGGTATPEVQIVDTAATPATKSLFAYLEEMSGKQTMFGHQHDTTVSIAGKDMNGSVISDVYSSTGDYPAVFGWDTLSLDGYEAPPGVSGNYEASRLGLTAAMKHAHELGGILTLSTHPYNFATGGSFNDTGNTKGATASVVARILPGGDKNADFNTYLNRIANFANNLKDDNGSLIPVLFRPFHEQNGGWFWWGAATTTKSEYAELYRYTVEYLRDVKGVHNFLYVFSPNGSFNGNENEYLTTYPGDQYVDILGMDQYDNKDNAGSEAFLNGLVKDLKMISGLAQSKGKIVTLSEYGYSAAGMNTTGNNEQAWFTKVLNAIKADPDAAKISYMLTWANFGEGNNLYVPYKNVPNKADHELVGDFVNFYKDSYSAFAGDIKNDNKYSRVVNAAAKQPFLHIVSPNNVGTVTEAKTVIRAKAANFVPAKVTYTAGGAVAETEMTLGTDGYYSAVWQPEASLNGTTADITVKAYGTGNVLLTQSISVFVKINEVAIKEIAFNTAADASLVQNNGTWSGLAGNGETIKTELQHAVLAGDGKLAVNISGGLSPEDSWQELKLQLTPAALEGVNLAKVSRVKLGVLIPEAAQNESGNAAVRTVVQLPEDWNTKYGMDSSFKALSILEKVTVDGARYYKYDAVVELDNAEKSAAATGLAISIVGSGLVSESVLPVYVDDIGLYNSYTAPVADNALVDDFESYGSSSEALAAKYPKAGGDDISATLSTERKNSGSYGMKLQYSLNSQKYAGVGKSLGSLDWSAYNAISLWVASDGSGSYAETGKPLKLVIQLVIDGGYFEAYPVITPDQNGKVVLSLKNLTEMSWGKGGALTEERLKQVQSFNLYVNSMDGQAHEGTLYFDDIQAVYDPSMPDLSGEDGGESGGHTPGVLYKFSSAEDIAGWVTANGDSAKAKAPVFSEEEQAAGVEFDLVNTGQNADGSYKQSFELAVDPVKLNLSGLDTINAKVKLSAGTAKARLFIKTGAGWTWSDSGTPVAVDSSGYKTLTISLPAAAEAAGVDLTAVKTIGIKIEDIANSGGTANLFLQEIALAAAVPDIYYGFEGGTDGWAATTGNAVVSKAVYAEGSQSLGLDFTWTGAGSSLEVSKTANLDLSSFSGITAKVRVVSDNPDVQAKLYLKLRGYAVWLDSGAKVAAGTGFTEFTIDFNDIYNVYVGSGAEFTLDDLQQVNALGIQLITPSEGGNATVYIDDVKVLQ